MVIPTYNEAENIARLVSEVLAVAKNLEIVIVDDNSPDGTGKIAADLARKNDRIQVIRRKGKLGLGAAYLDVFRRLLDTDTAYVITMDADFSHDPSYIPLLLEAMENFDVAVGSRYVEGGGVRDWPFYRLLLSRTAGLAVNYLLGLRVRDATGGYRSYRRQVLERIDLDRIYSSGYSFEVEMLYRVQEAGCRIGEIPIIFPDRKEGKSKMAPRELRGEAVAVLRLFLARTRRTLGF